jgi:hypothetical protein
MNNSCVTNAERQFQFLCELLEGHASIDGDVLRIGNDRWAIHGVIAVDGEVLMAGFDTYDEAKWVLNRVRDVGPAPWSWGACGSR